tara:strand:+ start:120 stop:761 length:642 start_codon:yes stop_codon:yes gene_type:complete
MPVLSSEEFRILDKNKKYTKKFTTLNNISRKERSEIKPLESLKQALKDDDIIGFIEKDNKIIACMFAEEDTYFTDKNKNCKSWSKNNECDNKPDFMNFNCALSCRRLKYKNFQQSKKTLYLYDVYTHPKYRGKGFCPLLAREYIRKFKDYILYLNLRKNNLSNINCYTKNNFIILPSSGINYDIGVDFKDTYAMIRNPKSKKRTKKKRKTKRR